MPPNPYPDQIERIETAEQLLAGCRSSLPYTPPEMAERRLLETAARVMNVLDPEGRLVKTPG